MKKVLLLAPMSSVHERFNKINIDILSKLGCEIHIAANFGQGDEETLKNNMIYKKKIESQGIKVHQINFTRGSFIRNLSVVRICRELFKTRNSTWSIYIPKQEVHCETCYAGKKQYKIMYTPHGISFYRGGSLKCRILYYPVEKWICGKMTSVLAMNTEEFEIIESWIKGRAKYIHGVGIDNTAIQDTVVDKLKKRKEFGIPENGVVLFSIGELNTNKNHEIAIRALAKLDDKNVYYLICGEGDLLPELENLSISLGLKDRVIFAGYRRDIPETIKIADIFVFPSFHEGLPVSLMEAMSAGLPCVISKIRGNVDLIEDKKGGFLYDSRDVNGFAEGIKKMIESSELRETMGKINAETVRKFSIDVVYSELKSIYEGVLK